MSGTRIGGKKTVETNRKKYGADYYKKIGASGGKAKSKNNKPNGDNGLANAGS